MRALAIAAGLALAAPLLASRAAAQDAPPTPAPATTPAPAPTPAPATTPVPAKADGLKLDFLTGSNPDVTIDAAFDLFLATFKKRSHTGYRELQGSRNGEVAFVEDLGFSSTQVLPGLRLTLDLGKFGYVGEEASVMNESDTHGFFQRNRFTNQIAFNPGDTAHAHGTGLWSNLVYGYELIRGRYSSDGDPVIDFFAAPEISFGLVDLDLRLRRVAPTPTNEVGGHMTAWCFGIGARAGVVLFDHFLLGGEVTELPGAFGVSSPRVHLWERVRAFVGVKFFHVKAEIGYRLQASHVQGDARGADERFTGVDFSLGVEF